MDTSTTTTVEAIEIKGESVNVSTKETESVVAEYGCVTTSKDQLIDKKSGDEIKETSTVNEDMCREHGAVEPADGIPGAQCCDKIDNWYQNKDSEKSEVKIENDLDIGDEEEHAEQFTSNSNKCEEMEGVSGDTVVSEDSVEAMIVDVDRTRENDIVKLNDPATDDKDSEEKMS